MCFSSAELVRRLSDNRHSVAWAIATSMAHGHSQAIDADRPRVTANDRSASNDNTNAHEANASVISSAHQYVSPPARLRTRTAIEWVAASSTNGGTKATPAAN